jgi:hypothetical protein
VTVPFKVPGQIETVAGVVTGQPDTYYGVALSDGPLPCGKRVSADEHPASGLLCLAADVDVAHRCHKKANLPPTEAAALALIGEMPLVPTFIVHTGHGLQPGWLLADAWLLATDEDRRRASALLYGWHSLLWLKAQAHGWAVDSVFDLSRVLRLPGTINAKVEGERLPVRLIAADWARTYLAGDFEPFLPQIEAQECGPGPGPEFDLRPPPADKAIELLEDSRAARMGWHRKHKRGDTSASGQDWKLALAAADGGWPAEEIAGLLLLCRRFNGDSLKHPRYYTRTAAKAVAAAEA